MVPGGGPPPALPATDCPGWRRRELALFRRSPVHVQSTIIHFLPSTCLVPVAPGNWVCLYNCLPATGCRLPSFGFVLHRRTRVSRPPGRLRRGDWVCFSPHTLCLAHRRRDAGFQRGSILPFSAPPRRASKSWRRRAAAGQPNWLCLAPFAAGDPALPRPGPIGFVSHDCPSKLGSLLQPATDYRLLPFGFHMSLPSAFKSYIIFIDHRSEGALPRGRLSLYIGAVLHESCRNSVHARGPKYA
jgi:hypothetical protein